MLRYCTRNREATPGRVRHAVGHRHRHRHDARGAGPRDRAVLHHQAARQGQRPGPQHDLWVRPAVGRASRHRKRVGRGHHGAALSAAHPGGAAASGHRAHARTPPLPRGKECDPGGGRQRRMRTTAARNLAALGLSGAAGRRWPGRAGDSAGRRALRPAVHRRGHAERPERLPVGRRRPRVAAGPAGIVHHGFRRRRTTARTA